MTWSHPGCLRDCITTLLADPRLDSHSAATGDLVLPQPYLPTGPR
jgi:hypothetical protein